ncbi:MAG: hypothetical protein AB7Q17_10345 [Phycisphaerae bacterium]
MITVLVLTGAASAASQTINVTTTDDVTDFGGSQQVSNLPGPDGRVSFREACLAANNTPGPQTIGFAIPPSAPGWSGGVALLYMDFDVFLLTDDDTTVDFTTQTAYSGDTNPNGNEVGIQCSITAAGVPAMIVTADRCIIKGLDRVTWAGYAIKLTGNENRVIGCTISGALYAAVNVEGYFGGPTATGNIIGGTAPGEGNVLGGVSVLGASSDTVVVGNIVRGGGVRLEGATQYNHICSNVRVGGPTPEERNVISGGGGFGEEGFPTGQKISIVDVDGALIEGNYLGTNTAGSAAESPRAPTGVGVRAARNVVIRNNLISGIAVTGINHYAGQRFGTAVSVVGTSVDTQIYGNRIGTDATGSYAIPNLYGVVVAPFTASEIPTGTVVGGTLPGQANLIAFNESSGVRIHGSVVGVPIRGNSIHSNGGLGIDLLSSAGGAGVTPNDSGDDDVGGNGLQNFPVLTAAESSGAAVRVQGILTSTANATFRLDFFASPACDASGYGEGANYLGSADTTTDGGGNAAFSTALNAGVPAGWFATATATDANGNTSEFSACRLVEARFLRGDLNCDALVNNFDIDPFVLALTDAEAYALQFPNCDVSNADANGDGVLNNFDIDAFVACLANGACQ